MPVMLIVAIQKSFQIYIPDQEANTLCTVKDLLELVISKLQGSESPKCSTSAAFYRVRGAMSNALGIDRREIRPSTSLALVSPKSHRRRKWRQVQIALELELPSLTHPGWMERVFLILGPALVVATGLSFHARFDGLLLLALLGSILGAAIISLSPALQNAFPRRYRTVGDLSRDVLAINHAKISHQLGGWRKKEVCEAICRIIAMQTGIARAKITPEARLIADLDIE